MTFYFLRGATKAGGNSSLRQGRKLQESPCQARKSITDILNRPRADYRLAGDSFSDLAFSAILPVYQEQRQRGFSWSFEQLYAPCCWKYAP